MYEVFQHNARSKKRVIVPSVPCTTSAALEEKTSHSSSIARGMGGTPIGEGWRKNGSFLYARNWWALHRFPRCAFPPLRSQQQPQHLKISPNFKMARNGLVVSMRNRSGINRTNFQDWRPRAIAYDVERRYSGRKKMSLNVLQSS